MRPEDDIPTRPTVNPQAETIVQSDPFGLPSPEALAAHFPDLEFGEILGRGGMGAVYRAKQTRLDRVVALKIIRPESADDPMFAKRFNREARTLARLNHPNIISVFDFGEVTLTGDDGGERTLYYFLMEYVDGVNLRQLMQAKELSGSGALSIMSQVCDALQFAHDEGIVHRDIKPENIMVDMRGRVKIADFGLARLLNDKTPDYTLTGTNQVMGTPHYMAPEQMVGAKAVDHRADIYSMGVVFYEMLTGELPLGRFDPPSKAAAVDEQWDQIVFRALEKEPERRYQNASEVKSDVEEMPDRAPVGAAPGTEKRAVQQSNNSKVDSQTESESELESAEMSDRRTWPHFGLLTLGGFMILLGIPLLSFALLNQVKDVFLWIGMGLILGGGGCCAPAFSDQSRLPAGTRPSGGMLVQGGIMSLLGLGILLSLPITGGGVASIHPRNVFTWIGIGLFIGGGGCMYVAWESGRGKKKGGTSRK
jgi:tRNA A-37 threonylcarbamoyl transferase component Bud32